MSQLRRLLYTVKALVTNRFLFLQPKPYVRCTFTSLICPFCFNSSLIGWQISKIQIGLPFWYRLTRVVREKGPLNRCVCVCVGGWVATDSVAEWLACWTQAQKGLGSNRSRDAVG